MTETVAGVDDDASEGRDVPATASGRRLRWWRELAYVVAFYVVYSWVRNQFGSAGEDSTRIAYEHARDIIRIQDAMGLWFEPELQRWYLDLPGMGLIRAWNIYYGTAHFIVTAGALVWLYRRQPDRYSLWRSTLAAMTAAALIGFATYSLMPPRLLGDTSKFGACFEQQVEDCHGDGVVDTLATVDRRDADLLVCGSRAYGPLRLVLLGGVSSRLLHRAALPLLVVPRRGEAAA